MLKVCYEVLDFVICKNIFEVYDLVVLKINYVVDDFIENYWLKFWVQFKEFEGI